MSKRSMREALDAIHERAVKLMGLGLSEEAEKIVSEIIATSRLKMDLRGLAEPAEEERPSDAEVEAMFDQRQEADRHLPGLWESGF